MQSVKHQRVAVVASTVIRKREKWMLPYVMAFVEKKVPDSCKKAELVKMAEQWVGENARNAPPPLAKQLAKAAKAASKPRQKSGERPMPQYSGQFYVCQEDDTPHAVARMFGVDENDMARLNKEEYPGLTRYSKVQAGTQLKIPGKPGEFDHLEEDYVGPMPS